MTEDNVPRLDDDDVTAMLSMSNDIIVKESETNFAIPSLLSALTMHDTSQCIHKVMLFKKVDIDTRNSTFCANLKLPIKTLLQPIAFPYAL